MIDDNGCPIICDFGKSYCFKNDESDLTNSIEGT